MNNDLIDDILGAIALTLCGLLMVLCMFLF